MANTLPDMPRSAGPVSQHQHADRQTPWGIALAATLLQLPHWQHKPQPAEAQIILLTPLGTATVFPWTLTIGLYGGHSPSAPITLPAWHRARKAASCPAK